MKKHREHQAFQLSLGVSSVLDSVLILLRGMFLGCVGVLFCAELGEAKRLSEGPELKVLRKDTVLLHLKGDDWKRFKPRNVGERSVVSGQSLGGTGVTLLQVIQLATEKLTASERAEIDLVVLQTPERPHGVWIPWFLVNRYALALVLRDDGATLQTGWSHVLPIRTQPKIAEEKVLLAPLEVGQIGAIVLTRTSDQVPAGWSTPKRSDPLVLRGEKWFQQSCASCHSSSLPPERAAFLARARALESVEAWKLKHPSLPANEMQATDWKAIGTFFRSL